MDRPVTMPRGIGGGFFIYLFANSGGRSTPGAGGNGGNRATREGKWLDRVYLSRDTSLDDTDQLLGTVTHETVLAAGANYTSSLSAALPDGIQGNFTILV